MTLRKGLLAATMLALPMAAAQAQPVTGLYIGAGVGANFRTDADTQGNSIKTNTGWVALGSVGWGFGNGLRVELEGNYRTNEARGAAIAVPGVSTVGGTTTTVTSRFGQAGYLATYGAMVNALYDFNMGWPVVPYIGVGVGVGWNEIGGARQVVNTRSVTGGVATTASTTYTINDTDPQFAYQAIAGLAYSLGAMVPGLALTGEYRFYGTLDPNLNVTRVSGPAVPGVPGTISPTNYNHSLLVGLRYNFGVAPPPAPAAAVAPVAPAPARTFLVFFDWDRADLTDRARQIIAEAAENSRRVQVTRIEVAGHADRSGSPAYNQRLSQRRADNVAAELVRRGVARNIITVQAFGESRPLVPTADGVREPQNRRVEIVLR
ncbi:MAG: OmpA family protein [Acetobacteraceae bacterium]|nr:OmpA family protein [Acetobacteraceae bacterium]